MKLKLTLLAALLSLTPAIVLGQNVSVNYNHNQSFSQFHTYAWESNNPNQVKNSILAQVAKQDIDTALQGKGLQMVTADQHPDVIVMASGGMRQQTSYMASGMRGWGGGMTTISPEQNTVGTLIVDLYTAGDKTLFWRGVARDTLSSNGDKNQKLIGKAVTKMFKQWPK